ncbi:hypothetical protein RIF29_40723 [Crotalaria pallida]|uniref:Uncharacterized protein n=1 Tax=Crotalaria pallida TaxID=3830 RepID=A0AAN9E3Q2_CROPI
MLKQNTKCKSLFPLKVFSQTHSYEPNSQSQTCVTHRTLLESPPPFPHSTVSIQKPQKNSSIESNQIKQVPTHQCHHHTMFTNTNTNTNTNLIPLPNLETITKPINLSTTQCHLPNPTPSHYMRN